MLRLYISFYYEAIKKPGYNLAVLSWIADFADPTSFLEMFRPGSNINYTAWNNTEYENLLRLANAEGEIKNRYKKLAEVEQLLLTSHVIIPLSHNPSINVIDLYSVAGWYPNAINIHPFKFIKFKKYITDKLRIKVIRCNIGLFKYKNKYFNTSTKGYR